jgi:hypothetical protein
MLGASTAAAPALRAPRRTRVSGRASARTAAAAASPHATPREGLAVSRRDIALGVLGASLLPLLPAGAAEPAAAAAADGAGRLALITGANSGIGYETALGLARAGYTPLLACRTVDKGKAAAARIAATVPGATVRVLDVPLELGNLRTVAAFADAVRATGEPLHLLVNNAVRVRLPCAAAVRARLRKAAADVGACRSHRVLLCAAAGHHGSAKGRDGGRARAALWREPPGACAREPAAAGLAC